MSSHHIAGVSVLQAAPPGGAVNRRYDENVRCYSRYYAMCLRPYEFYEDPRVCSVCTCTTNGIYKCERTAEVWSFILFIFHCHFVMI